MMFLAKRKTFLELEKYFTVRRAKRSFCDIVIECNSKEYYVKVIKARKGDILTINCKNYFTGIKKNTRIYSLANSDVVNKIYIVYPKCKLVRKYINECEMEIIQKNQAFGMYFISFTDINDLVEILR